jgi:hypothetical protein
MLYFSRFFLYTMIPIAFRRLAPVGAARTATNTAAETINQEMSHDGYYYAKPGAISTAHTLTPISK